MKALWELRKQHNMKRQRMRIITCLLLPGWSIQIKREDARVKSDARHSARQVAAV
jgi:hypothetical protein